jgi:hypothetical protein
MGVKLGYLSAIDVQCQYKYGQITARRPHTSAPFSVEVYPIVKTKIGKTAKVTLCL